VQELQHPGELEDRGGGERRPATLRGGRLVGTSVAREVEHPVRERRRLGVEIARGGGLLRWHPRHGTGVTAQPPYLIKELILVIMTNL
jgi:hypothetical protein